MERSDAINTILKVLNGVNTQDKILWNTFETLLKKANVDWLEFGKAKAVLTQELEEELIKDMKAEQNAEYLRELEVDMKT